MERVSSIPGTRGIGVGDTIECHRLSPFVMLLHHLASILLLRGCNWGSTKRGLSVVEILKLVCARSRCTGASRRPSCYLGLTGSPERSVPGAKCT